MSKQKVFASYLDDDDETCSGYFDTAELEGSFVKITSGKNEITIPSNRLNKIKRKLE